MHLSTSLNVFETEYPISSAIEKCKAAGFRRLDFNYWDHQKYVQKMSSAEEEKWAQTIRQAADVNGVRFTQMHGPVHGRAFNSMVAGLNVDSFLELAKRSLKTAQTLGVSWVVFHPSMISEEGHETHKEVTNYNYEFFQHLFPTMEATGVGIALENMISRLQGTKKYCSDPAELVELIDRLNHPLVGACWDTGHGHVSSFEQEKSIKLLGHRLKATHIQDNDGNKDQHFLPYHGTINWDKVMQSLREVHYTNDFTYEVAQAIRVVPKEIRDTALDYASKIGKYLIKLEKGVSQQ